MMVEWLHLSFLTLLSQAASQVPGIGIIDVIEMVTFVTVSTIKDQELQAMLHVPLDAVGASYNLFVVYAPCSSVRSKCLS